MTTDRTIETGDWLLLDFGAQVDGYCADISRTYVVGARADERQRVIYELVREAQGRALGGIKSGMTGREADSLARSVIEARGFADAFALASRAALAEKLAVALPKKRRREILAIACRE